MEGLQIKISELVWSQVEDMLASQSSLKWLLIMRSVMWVYYSSYSDYFMYSIVEVLVIFYSPGKFRRGKLQK